jgi:uncharacterized integral membrane protein
MKEAIGQAHSAISQFTHPTRDYKSPKAVISKTHDRMSFMSKLQAAPMAIIMMSCKILLQTAFWWGSAAFFFGRAEDSQHFCNGQ